MECQERFCHGLIAVHFQAQRRQTRKNSRQKEEEVIVSRRENPNPTCQR
jgi:hypothetical protein